MADSEEQINFKKRARRRIVGAVALVMLVAIVLPMVFDKEPKPLSSDVNIQIPNPDNKAFKNQVVPAPPSAAQESSPGAAGQVVVVPSQAIPTVVAGSAKPGQERAIPPPPPMTPPPAKADPKAVPAVNPEAAAKVAPKANPEPAARPGASPAATSAPRPAAGAAKSDTPHATWSVKLDAFSESGNVKRLQAKLTGAGIKSYTEVVQTEKGSLTRVWAGPYPNRTAAERARDKLKKMGLNGVASEK